MKYKSIFYFLGLLLIWSCDISTLETHDRNNDRTIIQKLKKYDLKGAETLIYKKDSSLLKNLFYYEKTYLDEGRNFDMFTGIDSISNYSEFIQGVFHYTYGDFLKRNAASDSTKFVTNPPWLEHYLKAYQIATGLKDTLLVTESLRRINQQHQEVHKDIDKFSYYQDKLSLYAKDSIDVFWSKYYGINIKLLEIYEGIKPLGVLNDSNFQDAIRYSQGESYFQGILYQLWGIYYNLLKKTPTLGKYYFDLAEIEFEKSSSYPAKKNIDAARFNAIITLYDQNKYGQAITLFEKVFNNEHGNSNRSLFLKEKSANWLYKSFKGLGNSKRALFYKEQEAQINQIRKEYEQVAFTRDIDIKYDTQSKSKEISRLQKMIAVFSRHKLIYGSAILLTLILAAYSVRRWWIVDKKNKKLSELVIKKHIVLKDKVRIQLEELMYVESTKHHITLFCEDAREVVRYPIGKLSEQLPPNFKRCHNSFIVNENYIRNVFADRILLKNGVEIRISRKYKNNFRTK